MKQIHEADAFGPDHKFWKDTEQAHLMISIWDALDNEVPEIDHVEDAAAEMGQFQFITKEGDTYEVKISKMTKQNESSTKWRKLK